MLHEGDVLDDLDQLRSRYDVLAPLGYDGAYRIYRARSRGSSRLVAIKAIAEASARVGRPGALHAWQAHTLQPLEDPHLLTLSAVHHLQGGTVALAMERWRGHTLADIIERSGPLPIPRAESTLRDIAEALIYLHDRDVVHRGVRPEAIFIEPDSGRARLALFAIDRNSEGTESAVPTALIRSFAYLAPEQIDGKTQVDNRHVDRRSDLYSLGLVGYAMVSGAQPWDGSSLQAVMDQQRNQPLPPLSSLRSSAPVHLCRAIEGCLEKDPRRRWKCAEEFLEALDPATETAPSGRRKSWIELTLPLRNVFVGGSNREGVTQTPEDQPRVAGASAAEAGVRPSIGGPHRKEAVIEVRPSISGPRPRDAEAGGSRAGSTASDEPKRGATAGTPAKIGLPLPLPRYPHVVMEGVGNGLTVIPARATAARSGERARARVGDPLPPAGPEDARPHSALVVPRARDGGPSARESLAPPRRLQSRLRRATEGSNALRDAVGERLGATSRAALPAAAAIAVLGLLTLSALRGGAGEPEVARVTPDTVEPGAAVSSSAPLTSSRGAGGVTILPPMAGAPAAAAGETESAASLPLVAMDPATMVVLAAEAVPDSAAVPGAAVAPPRSAVSSTRPPRPDSNYASRDAFVLLGEPIQAQGADELLGDPLLAIGRRR